MLRHEDRGDTMRFVQIQIVPRDAMRLYGAMVKKEAEIRKNKRGTFFRARGRARSRATWKHRKYRGQINLERGPAEAVAVEVRSPEGEGQILKAFLDWLDRHFSNDIQSVSIRYH
jgi:hypothetical protein